MILWGWWRKGGFFIWWIQMFVWLNPILFVLFLCCTNKIIQIYFLFLVMWFTVRWFWKCFMSSYFWLIGWLMMIIKSKIFENERMQSVGIKNFDLVFDFRIRYYDSIIYVIVNFNTFHYIYYNHFFIRYHHHQHQHLSSSFIPTPLNLNQHSHTNCSLFHINHDFLNQRTKIKYFFPIFWHFLKSHFIFESEHFIKKENTKIFISSKSKGFDCPTL